MTAERKPPGLRAAVVLTTSSSFLVPLVGIVTAPLLARALSPEGRGELAAALGPATLMLAVATLGLPEALTYLLARRPWVTRRALMWSTLVTVSLGTLFAVIAALASDYLSDGDRELAFLIVLAVWITVPALLTNVLRGAASGLQMWGRVALDRVVVTLWRLFWFVALFVTDHLTVLAALLVVVTAPFAALVLYLPRLLRSDLTVNPGDSSAGGVAVFRPLVTFGSQVWFGAVAGMLLARVSQIFMVPLSSAEELGLFSVAITVADVPLVAAFAVQAALFGVGSRNQDPTEVTRTSRAVFLLAILGSAALAGLTPLLISPLFGPEFADALIPCLLLILSAAISLPGLMAGSGLAAFGRPGLRSLGLAMTLLINVAAFFLLVPPLGALGAGVAGLISTAVMNVFMVAAAARVLSVSHLDLWLVRRDDVRFVVREIVRQVGRFRPRRGSD